MRQQKYLAPLVLSVLLLSPPVLAADWQPAFTPGQAVYVDPALASSQSAPIKFGDELEERIKDLRSKSGINYYVWAVEAKDAPTDKPLGVSKANEAIAAWGSQANFPNNNYALIVWARRAENPAKGGIGINLSAGLQKFDVAPIIKGKMPQNPKGAILAIAQTVANNKADAIAQEKAFKDFGNAAKGFLSFILLTIPWLFLGWVGTIFFSKKKKQKAKATELTEKWTNAVKNATDIYLEITADDALDFYSSLYKEQETIAGFLNESKKAIARFLCLYQKAKDTSDAANQMHSEGKYKEITHFLEMTAFRVNFGKLPLEKASVLNGLDDEQNFTGRELLANLDDAAKQVLKFWAVLKKAQGHQDPNDAAKFIVNELTEGEKINEEQQTPDTNNGEGEEASRYFLSNREAIMERARQYAAKKEAQAPRTSTIKGKKPAQRRSPSTTVFVDNSTYYSGSSSRTSNSDSSWSSSSDSGSSSSDWGSSGSDYSDDSGSFGGDY